MSEGSLRLKLKFGLNEVEIEGSIQDITKSIEIIQNIFKVIPNSILEKNQSLIQNSESDHLDKYFLSSQLLLLYLDLLSQEDLEDLKEIMVNMFILHLLL